MSNEPKLKVKLLQDYFGPCGDKRKGEVIEVGIEEGEQLLKGRYAEAHKEVAQKASEPNKAEKAKEKKPKAK